MVSRTTERCVYTTCSFSTACLATSRTAVRCVFMTCSLPTACLAGYGAAEQCPITTCFSPLPTGQWPSNPFQSPLLLRVSFALQGSAQLSLFFHHCPACGSRHCGAVPYHDFLFPTARQAVPGTAQQYPPATCLLPLPCRQWPSNPFQSPLLLKHGLALSDSAIPQLALPPLPDKRSPALLSSAY